MADIESEWTAQDREQGGVRGTDSDFPPPRLAPKTGARTWGTRRGGLECAETPSHCPLKGVFFTVLQIYCTAESAFVSLPGCASEPVPASLGGSKPTTPRRVSQAAWFSAGSDPTRSRIIFQAATLRAPSGGGPIARATEHWGQKQIRCAADFCRGFIPTVCANINTPTDFCPASKSRLQRRQKRCSNGPLLAAKSRNKILSSHPSGRK